MKKLWVSLLAMLLTCALLIGAWAEEMEIEWIEGEEWEEYAPEEAVEEVEEFELQTEEGEEESEIAALPTEDDEETAIAAPEYEPKSASSDFEIKDGVLVKYHGAGGDVTIPNGVTSIGGGLYGKGAFDNCTSLTSVTIPNSVTSIGEYAFAYCDSLTSITIPNSVKIIGAGAFEACGLTRVTIPNGVTSIGSWAFADCEKLTSVTIPNSVKSIGDGAFNACGLTSVMIPNSIPSINHSMFRNCKNLTSVTIPSSVKSIGDGAFLGCESLTSVTIPGSVTIIEYYAFLGCESLTSITIPASVQEINLEAFCACSKLASVYVESSTTVFEVADEDDEGCDIFKGTDPNLTIYCKSGSTAEAYAKKLGIKYKLTDVHTHTPVTVKGKAATCTATGLTDGVKCSVCGEWITKQQTIAKKAHTPTTVKGYAATYVKVGLSDGSKCSVCGTTLTAQKTIARKTYPGSVLAKKGKNGTITVNLGEQFLLTPAFATSAGLTVKGYKSSKAKVVTVDKTTGLVKPLKEGKATITVTTNNKKKKATVVIKVVDPYKPTGISITNGKKVTLEMGKTLKLGTKLKPDTAQSNLIFKSGKKSVATVDGNGLVTPHKEGTAKITVTTRNKKKATITVKVVDPYKPTGISITNGKTVTLKVGQTLKLGTALKPTTAQSELTWKSANKKIATVDATGTVKALKKGKVKITVTTKKNKKKATITVKVVP